MVFGAIVSLISIVGLAFAAYCAYKIYEYNRLSTGWLAIVLAFVMLVLSRIICISGDLDILKGVSPAVLKAWDVILILFTGILFITGMCSMKKSFENFDIIEKQAENKAAIFKKSKGGAK